MIEFLKTIGTVTPLGVVVLLALVLLNQSRNKKTLTEITDNHLHEMPEIAETLRRIELVLSENFAYIRARLNGGPK